MIRSLRASASRDPLLRVAHRGDRVEHRQTRAGAPPCSGPESAPTADESAAPQSAPVEATTRAVNVDALSPCSAVQIQYVSIAFACLVRLATPLRAGTAPPPSRPLARSLAEPARLSAPAAPTGRRSTALAAERRRRSSFAWSSSMSISLPSFHLPLTGRRAPPGDRTCSRRCGPRARSTRPGSRARAISSTSSPHTFSNGTSPTSVLDVDAAVAELAALLVGLRDLRLERDDAREAWAECQSCVNLLQLDLEADVPRSRAAASTSAAAARSWTATPTDLYSVISIGAGPAAPVAGDELAELDDAAAIDAGRAPARRPAAARTRSRATRRRRVGRAHDRRVELGAAARRSRPS